ncbi:hypothetical protein [Actinoplanes sp. NPDC051851]|uniref:hypothetical protein n=1 Tax=Actinoplanes sp. NPDC051851 TaxID=3154753 RepID=UPI003429A288
MTIAPGGSDSGGSGSGGSGSDSATPPNPYGAYPAAEGLGGVAAPLLAAAAATLLGLVLQIEASLRWPGLALLLLAVATVLMLRVVQCNARARGYAVTPGEALAWYPDADDPERRRVVFAELERHRAAWRFWIGSARRHYNLGVLFLLLGTMVTMVPADSAALTPARWLAIGVIGLGCAAEVLAVLLDRRRPAWWSRWWAVEPGLRWYARLPARAVRWAAPPDPPVPPARPAGSAGGPLVP